MGTVYEAWQRSLKRTVALKVLSRQVSASKTAVARFHREAQAAAKLHHIHIVPIFALGDEQGTYFYAMELIEGQSLGALITGKRARQQADTATVVLDETVALDRSDGDGAPHVELKAATEPQAGGAEADDSNVTLITSSVVRFSREHFVEIAAHIADVADALDYAHRHGVIHRDIKPHNLLMGNDGRLHVLDFGLARLAEQPGVTVTGELLGSPLYMSPEQLSGESRRVDQATDIYSLGATMYEWLTLKPPYPGETRERVISMILTSQALAPRTHNSQIPLDLETICMKAMERDPSRRYRTAGELRDDLHRFVKSRPIKAKRAGLGLRASRLIKRHQLVSISTAAALVLLTIGSAWLSNRGQVQVQTQAVAELQEKNEQIIDLVSVLPLELGAPLRMAGAFQELVGPNQLGLSVPGFGSVGSTGLPAVGTPTAIARRLAKAFYDATAPTDWPAAADSSDEPATLLREAVRVWDADSEKALTLLDGYLTMRPDDYDARRMRAALYAGLGRFSGMFDDSHRLVELRGESANGYIWRGLAHLLLDRGHRSLDDLARAMQFNETSAWAKIARGLALIRNGRAGGAILDFEDALRERPDLMLARLGRASAYYASGKMQLARSDIDRVLEDDPDDVDALTIGGDCHTALGDLTAAARDFERALNIAGRNNAALAIRYLSVLVQQQRLSKVEAAEADRQPDSEAKTETPESIDGSTRASPVERFLRSIWRRLRGNAGKAVSQQLRVGLSHASKSYQPGIHRSPGGFR